MRSILFLIAAFVLPLSAYSQASMTLKGDKSGLFSIGMRSTVSMFNGHDWNSFGVGGGGQFRIQLMDFLNNEYFSDYILSDIGGFAHRQDFHIGTSFMFYPIPGNKDFSKIVVPFLETGICYDFTRIVSNQDATNAGISASVAWPVGLGVHFNLTPRFDITLKAQYMMHLGTDLDAHEDAFGEVVIDQHFNPNLEGHLLVTLSANYKLFDIWSKKGFLNRVYR